MPPRINVTYIEVHLRREKLKKLLRKSIRDKSILAKIIGCSPKTIDNDMAILRKLNQKLKKEYENDGYTFATQEAIGEIEDIIIELQQMRQNTALKDPANFKIAIQLNLSLAQLISQRWAMEGDGLKLSEILGKESDEDTITIDDTEITSDTNTTQDIPSIMLDDDEFDEAGYEQFANNYDELK